MTTRNKRIDNSMDIIDSRDVIARIEELKGQLAHWYDPLAGNTTLPTPGTYDPDTDPEGDRYEDVEELCALLALANDAERAADWEFGATLIRDSHFETYAQELAEDIGAIGRDLQWPLMHIDWDAAAEALKQDYMAVEFDCETYWIRR